MSPPPVTTHGLGVNIAGRPILRDISMSIQSGDVVAILGANGSGKSTLIKAILNQAAATSGSVALFGTPARSFQDWARIGYVPQHSSLSQGVVASVKEVVASGRLSRRGPFRPSRTTDRRAIAEALDVVGLADRAGHPVSTLSG
ncbi:MAG TPA: ATP-binding cassette domain-containing protein, partial [Marmoricola sp.]|nr:ATP-binding cassette domain-containing protein [Marmoricola sp.]